MQDQSDDIHAALSSIEGVLQLNVRLVIRCLNEETSSHYVQTREDLIAKYLKTKTQRFVSTAVYDHQSHDNDPYHPSMIPIGSMRQFWIVDEDQWIVKHFTADSVYWVFCTFLLQWLYVLLAHIVVSKRATFTVRKAVSIDQTM